MTESFSSSITLPTLLTFGHSEAYFLKKNFLHITNITNITNIQRVCLLTESFYHRNKHIIVKYVEAHYYIQDIRYILNIQKTLSALYQAISIANQWDHQIYRSSLEQPAKHRV